jgi:hypothetical protein
MNDLNRFEKINYSDEQFIYYNKNHDPFLIGWIDKNNQFNGKKFIYSIEGYLLEIKFYVNGFLFSSDINLNQVEKVPSENFNLSSKKKNKSLCFV